MKTRFTSVCTAVLLASSLWLNAGETEKSRSGSPEFERMKSLVGTWTGKTDMGQGPVDMTVEYRLVAAGSAVEERCFPGTTNEMVSMAAPPVPSLMTLHNTCAGPNASAKPFFGCCSSNLGR